MCCAAVLVALIQPVAAQQVMDTSHLPRLTGTTEVYASPALTIFTTPEPVPATVETVNKTFVAAGWQRFGSPYSEAAEVPNQAVMNYKKGPHCVTVFIAVAPAQKGATGVRYATIPMAHDVPFPKDATEIRFDPKEPKLIYKTAAPIGVTMDFFRTELVALNWSPWSTEEGRRVANGDKTTKKSGHAYYVHGAYRPLGLSLQLKEDSLFEVTLYAFGAEGLVALGPPRKVAETKPVDAPKTNAKPNAGADGLAESILRQAQVAIDEAMAKAKMGTRPATPSAKKLPEAKPADVPAEKLAALVDNATPIPLPHTAESVEFDAANHTLEFATKSSVGQITSFFRVALKPLGWKEQPMVINQDELVLLAFTKGYDDLGIRIVKASDGVKVYVNGEALAPAAAVPAPVTAADLEVEEKAGLPVPADRTMTVADGGKFRSSVDASVTAGLDAVLGFYRRELDKRNWKEGKSDVKSDRAEFGYTTVDGPAVLKLGRHNGETTIHISLRNTTEAVKSGLMAKAGQSKILLGNVTGQEAVITINKQTIKVAAGAGTKAPDGPTLELAPGTYKYSSKVTGKPVKEAELKVGKDEIWGLMIGPGGVLEMQMY